MTSDEREGIDLLICGPDIVCLDHPGTIVTDGAIAVSGNRIDWIGPRKDALQIFRAESTIDASGQIAMPGLVDTHVHAAQHLLRGKISQIGQTGMIRLPLWQQYYLPFEAQMSPEDVHLSARVCYANMIRVGTTCFAEAGGPHPDEMGRAALEAGIRGFVALSTLDQGAGYPPSVIMETQEAFKSNVELVERWQDQDRVKAWLALRQIITCSPRLISMMVEAATDLDTRIHMHLCEGTYEVDYTMQRFSKRPADVMSDMGALGGYLHAAHSTLASPEELDLYRQHDCSVSHCPFNNYHVGPHPLLRMVRRGIRVGLGTDGASSWGPLDLFRAAHAARIGQQAVTGTPMYYYDVMPSEKLIRVATNGGAAALGLADQIGSLEVGKKADILLLSTGDLDQLPLYDPLFAIATLTVGRDVQTVVIDGKVVMKDRELLTIDQEELTAELECRLPAMMSRFQ